MTQARIPGELILDNLFGQKDSNMISLPSVAAAVLAAAAAAACAVLPHLHRAVRCWWRQRLLVQPALGRKLLPQAAAVAAAAAVSAVSRLGL